MCVCVSVYVGECVCVSVCQCPLLHMQSSKMHLCVHVFAGEFMKHRCEVKRGLETVCEECSDGMFTEAYNIRSRCKGCSTCGQSESLSVSRSFLALCCLYAVFNPIIASEYFTIPPLGMYGVFV